jgi:hypothetical protein
VAVLVELAATDAVKGTPRRFDVELFIVHPTLKSPEITTALGLEPKNVHTVGDGGRKDTRWRFSTRYEVEDQWFAVRVTELVDRLALHEEFFHKLRSTGGDASIIVQFLGDGYFGDEIPRSTLEKMLKLELAFAIECFQVRQT